MVFRLFLCFISFLFIHRIQAQDDRTYRKYNTQQVHQRLLAENPNFASQLASMETHIQSFGMAEDGKIDTIPIVFHILYTAGQIPPDEFRILAQLDSINKDFQEYRAPESPYVLETVQELGSLGKDPELFFCLASSDVDGGAINPIEYVETTVGEWDDNDLIKKQESGGVSVRNPEQILNIWIGNLAGGMAGYAQMPGGPAESDGIVIDPNYLAQSSDPLIAMTYDKGKTLTHLIGSYLGLYELWNDSSPCSDDFVDDTPVHNVPNYFPGDIYYHISLCDTTYPTEMIMNFMDNTDDEVLNMFTQGQKNRMKAVLASDGPRASLSSGSVHCDPGMRIIEGLTSNKNELTAKNPSIRLHPNPANQIINLELITPESGKVSCTVFNFLGSNIWQDEMVMVEKTRSLQIDCSSWSEGMYLISVIFERGERISQNFIISIP